ncbi:MAG: hypothetical protein JWM19_4138 [Actinomycetia bacterium]|nr:hypothetical protein [Actinomycetes bacterium]
MTIAVLAGYKSELITAAVAPSPLTRLEQLTAVMVGHPSGLPG